jgi:uncharacterized membrane protein
MTQETTLVDVIVAAFPTEDGAREALHALDDAKNSGVNSIKDAVVLRKTPDGKLLVSESADKGFGRGALIGGVAGAAVGIIAGPIGWATLGGAAIGGPAAKLRDGGFSDERLREVGQGVAPGSSTLIAVVEETWLPDAQLLFLERGAELAAESVTADLAAQLDQQAHREQEPGTDRA